MLCPRSWGPNEVPRDHFSHLYPLNLKELFSHTRDRRDYRYRIDTKAAGISIGLDPGISWVSVSVSVSIQSLEHFLEGFGRILIK